MSMLIRYFLCVKIYELCHYLWCIFVAVGVIVINISCGNDHNVKIAKLQSVKVTRPVDKMVSVKNGEIKKYHVLADKPRFIHLLDKRNRIVLLGNPITNNAIYIIYFL